MGSSSLKKPLTKKPLSTMATEDKTGELPIPVKKPVLVPMIKMGEEEKTKDLPTPAKIKDMIAKENKDNVLSINDGKLQSDIAEINGKSSKLQEELNKVSKFLIQENKKIMPLLEKNLEEGKKSAEVISQNIQDLTDLKSLVSQFHDDYKNEVNNLEIRRAQLLAEVTNLELVTETYNKTKNQYESLSDEYSLLSLQKHEVEQEMSKLIISGKDQVVELQTQKVKCESELAWIKLQLNAEAQHLEKHEKLIIEVAQLELKHHEISLQYQEKFSTISNFAEQCESYTKKIEDLKILEADEKAELTLLQIQKKNCEQALAFINVELHEFAIKKESMQFEEADLDQIRVGLGKEIIILEKKHYEMSALMRSRAESLATIQADCEKYSSNLESLKKQEIFEKNEISRLHSEKMHGEHQLSLLKLDIHEFTLKKEQKINEEIELEKKKGILEQKNASIELKFEDSTKRLREKTDALSITHEEWTALSKKVEQLKMTEHNLQSDTAELKDQLSKLKDAASFSEEKRIHYQSAIKEAEENYQNKIGLFEKEYQYKLATMEFDLKMMEEKGLSEVKARIDETQEAIHHFLNRNQDLLAEAIGDAVYVKGQYSLIKVESAPDFDEVKTEIKKVIGSYFHQSVHPNYKEKIMQKIYFYWASSATLLAAGSILLWYFKK